MSEELVTYKANCHCGTVKFTVKLPDILSKSVTRCTCSICTKNGYLLVYPKSEDVHYVSGKDDLGAYRFGGATKRHLFCKNCGNSLFIDFSTSEHPSERDFTAVNVSIILVCSEQSAYK